MTNIISSAINSIGQAIGGWLAPFISSTGSGNANVPPENLEYRYATLRNYYNGDHRPQLKDKEGKAVGDNITINIVGLAVDRSVSRLFRGGVTWKLPEGRDKQKKYLDKAWEVNHKEIVLKQLGLHGSVYGTPFVKISPDAITDPLDGKEYPRLIPLDTELVRIKTDPQDMDKVALYQIKYQIGKLLHYEITRRSDVAYSFDQNSGDAVVIPTPINPDAPVVRDQWVIEEWETDSAYSNKLNKISSTNWEYDFPPILHWKNLPSLRNCYGDCDIDDAINVQDKYNFIVGNEGKIIKFHAHPQTIVTGASVDQLNKIDTAIGSVWGFPGESANAFNLEMQNDLASTRALAVALKQAVSDITREPDSSSLTDKAGALTNFAVHVLYGDAVDKNDTKRQLYGDALKELNRRLLVLSGETGENSNPGEIQWGEALPVNIQEEMTADETALRMGVIDKETIMSRWQVRYGKSPEDIKKALKAQQETDNQNNLGGVLLRLREFNKGQGAEGMTPAQASGKFGQQPGKQGANG